MNPVKSGTGEGIFLGLMLTLTDFMASALSTGEAKGPYPRQVRDIQISRLIDA